MIYLSYHAPRGVTFDSTNPTTLDVGNSFTIGFSYDTNEVYPNLQLIEQTYRELLGVSEFDFHCAYLSRAVDDTELYITIEGTVGSDATGGDFDLTATGMVHSIIKHLEHCSIKVNEDFLYIYYDAPQIVTNAPLPIFDVTADTGYTLPDNIIATNSTFSWEVI